MTNKELQEIKNKKEKFYLIRNQLVRESCKEIRERSKSYNNIINSNPEYKYYLYNPSIRQNVLDDLESSNYSKKDLGTQYLATLITIYYHERYLFRRRDLDSDEYFDLSNKNNEHYSMLGTTKEKAISEMEKVINRNEEEDATLPEIVYDLADAYIHIKKEKGYEKKYYTKTLLKK